MPGGATLLEQRVRLPTGAEMPRFGLGTYLMESKETHNACKWALAAGYRLLDTAAMYDNEEEVGRALRESGVPRGDVFVSTKLLPQDMGYTSTKKAFAASLSRLGLEYVDLYLVHWPGGGKRKRLDTWRAMEEIHAAGQAKAIGVSNWTKKHLLELEAEPAVKVQPMVNQCEFHPQCQWTACGTRAHCIERGMVWMSYMPLASGALLKNKEVRRVAREVDKTPAQVLLRWNLLKGSVVFPKTVKRARLEENAALGFDLSPEHVAALDAMHCNNHYDWDPGDVR